MIFDQANAQHLKPWLVRTLEPICDAEPGALADYILALLKHNVPEPEMRKELTVQLDEFLEKECSAFIDTLFTALRTKSYLPYTDSSPTFPSQSVDTGIPIPLDGLLSPSIPTSPDGNRKRSLESPERDNRAPAKGPRISSEGQFSRYQNGRGGQDSRSTGGWSSRGRPQGGAYRDGTSHMGEGMNGRQPAYQPPDQRRICRDYYNLGFCSRGALCKYSHGEDALVPDQLYMNGVGMQGAGMPFMPMFGVGFMGPGAAYDPHEARMDMRGIGQVRNQARPAVLPRMPQEEGSRVVHSVSASGELPVIQDLTPEVAHNDVTPNPIAHPSSTDTTSNSTPGFTAQPNHYAATPGPSYINGSASTPMSYSSDVEMGHISEGPPPGSRPMGNWRGRGRGRGRGFGSEAGTFRPERRNDKTLVLEKIPDDKLSLAHVNDWFKRFGTVTNVAIDQAQRKALISFSTHEEANAAWKSEDAVFNNRFVKIFWHRPMEGQGDAGRRMLAASAPLVANVNVKETSTSAIENSPAPSIPTAAPTYRKNSSNSTAVALAAKQQLLEQQITEQKSLMASLDKASSEEKKQIMARFKKLDEEMKASSSSPAVAVPSKVPSDQGDWEQKERERLNKELELHHTTDAESGEAKSESTEDLKAKLERLKAEAASLGISDDSQPGYPAISHRPYRGRGRGYRATYFRGGSRGGPPRASMKLDNRPRKLLVKGVSHEGEQALRDWYETTGQLESVLKTEEGDMVVAFKSRSAAEQGLAKGTSIPTVGSVQVSWYSGAQSTTAPGPEPLEATPPQTGVKPDREPNHTMAQDSSPHHADEEVIASGWGNDDEDGMGMI